MIHLIIMLLILLFSQQNSIGQEQAGNAAAQNNTQQLHEEQLKINRDALLEGKTEQTRIQAATLIISDESESARKIILDILKVDKNIPARMAICKALSKSRTEKKEIKNKEDFIIPLLSIIVTSEDAMEVKLVAETLLIFEYSQIAAKLEMIATEPSSPVKSRLNAIYALRLQPDMRATIQLIKMVDTPEAEVSVAAENALRSIGIPIGAGAQERKKIIKELEDKGNVKFLQELLILQELNMDKLNARIKLWQERYLTQLDKNYSLINDDTERGKFLAAHLSNPEISLKLWALDKVDKWRQGTSPKANMLAEAGPALIKLISEENKEVRLKTVKLLSLIGELDSSGALAEQFKIETNEEVKTELLVALGWACYNASLPSASIRVSAELKRQALIWGEEYLSDDNIKKARVGAEVIRKLLEHNGLNQDEVTKYLNLLAQRYTKQKEKQADGFCDELLAAMSRICGQSVYKERAADIFKSLFEDGLNSESDSLRDAAVDGLIYINKSQALQRLRRDFTNDKNEVIRKKVIALAEEAGGKDDLSWLSEKIGNNSEGKPAWQAMLKIFKRSEAEITENWFDKLNSKLKENKLSDVQMLSFLELAEGKATAEKNTEMLRKIQMQMAKLYKKSGDFERSAKYYGTLLSDNPRLSDKEKELVLAELLDVYLLWPNIEGAKKLINLRVLEEDLEPECQFIEKIELYLSNPPAGNDPNSLIEQLNQIEIPEDRPKWSEQIKKWCERFEKAADPNIPKPKST